MRYILAFVGVLAFFPMLFTPFIAYSYFKDGNMAAAGKSVLVFLVCAGLVLAIPKSKGTSRYSGDNCYTDWDGRSNPTVCD